VVARLQLERVHGNVAPYIRVYDEGGRYARALVDTGCGGTYASEALASRLAATGRFEEGYGFLSPAGGSYTRRGRPARTETRLQFGRGIGSRFAWRILPHLTAHDCDCIVGADSFSNLALLFDFPHARLTVFSAGRLRPRALARLGFGRGRAFEFGLWQPPISSRADVARAQPSNPGMRAQKMPGPIRLSIRGTDCGDVLVDTGAAVTVVDPQLARSVCGSPVSDTWPATHGIRKITARSLWADRVRLGDVDLPPAAVARTESPADDIQTLVGMDLLRHFAMLVDYGAGRIYLRPGLARYPGPRSRQPLAASLAGARTDRPRIRAVLPGGEPCWFEIDSNLGKSWISRAPRGASVPTEQRLTRPGADHLVTMRVKVGGKALLNGRPITFDIWKPDISRLDSSMVGGLGLDVLAEYAVTLDSTRRRALFWYGGHIDPTRRQSTGTGPIPMPLTTDGYVVLGRSGPAAGLFRVATACRVSTLCSPGYLKSAPKSHVFTSARNSKVIRLIAGELSIGQRRLHRVALRFAPVPHSQIAGLLGRDLLGGDVVTYDFPAQRLYPGLAGRDLSGVLGPGLIWDRSEERKLRVADVVRPSPAYSAGLRPGDVILSANGRPAVPGSCGRVVNEIDGWRAGQLRIAVRRRGHRRRLLFALAAGPDRPGSR
jgi:predicted aspartyl protease